MAPIDQLLVFLLTFSGKYRLLLCYTDLAESRLSHSEPPFIESVSDYNDPSQSLEMPLLPVVELAVDALELLFSPNRLKYLT
jgi:hypothetical protein